MNYIISCESPVDFPYQLMHAREISVLFYEYIQNGIIRSDNMEIDKNALEKFYQRIKDGFLPSTSQINMFQYLEYFRKLLKQGDVLHISFGSGMTPSVNHAFEAAESLRSEFPDRRLIVIDSTCSCCGYGLLVEAAADLRDQGKKIDEVAKNITSLRTTIHHQFFTTEMKFFKKSGRVSGPAAAVATILNLCPIMRLNQSGKIYAYDKVRGKKNAISRTVDEILVHATSGTEYNGKMIIAHSNCPELADQTKQAIQAVMPKLTDLRIMNIGMIIAAHCGPGTVACFFFGDDRPQ